MKITPTEPPEASLRFILQVLSKGSLKSYNPDPRRSELEAVAEAFRKSGGSWEGIFRGSIDDIDKLKRMLGKALKKGLITCKDW